jgi:phosphoribosylanthranilate isomerase
MKHNTVEVASLGPDYLGFILWEGSARYYGASSLPQLPEGIRRVGVFVDAAPEALLQQTAALGLDAVQLHGEESPEYCADVKKRLGKKDLIKAFALGPGFEFAPLEAYLPCCDFFLFDTRGPLPGGNGVAFDWGLLEAYPFEKPFFLSGGIGVSDAAKLGAFLQHPAGRHCHAVDVNSRFEVRPGEKDLETLQAFMDSPFWKAGAGGK